MPWYEKEQRTPFEAIPVNGLNFLHGDVVARKFGQEWAQGKKYPLITFPSGTSREIIPAEQAADIHLFGRITVPRTATYTDTFNHLLQAGQGLGLKLIGDSGETIVVLNPASMRGYTLNYDPVTHELANIVPLPLPHEAMELLPGNLRAVLPKLHSQEQKGLDAIAPLKFFTPDANWTWYPTEFDGDDLFFGLVNGFMVEFGYFSLTELESVRGPMVLPIERDVYFKPQSLQALKAYHDSL
jgi:hypothetical protein